MALERIFWHSQARPIRRLHCLGCNQLDLGISSALQPSQISSWDRKGGGWQNLLSLLSLSPRFLKNIFYHNIYGIMVIKCIAEKGGEMVRCCNATCYGEWFYLSCVKLQRAPSKDWYCSKVCRDNKSYVYCTCQSHSKEDGQMIQCGKGVECTRFMYYHPSCISVSHVKGLFFMHTHIQDIYLNICCS